MERPFIGDIHDFAWIFAAGRIPAGVAIGIGIGIETDSGFSIPIAIPTPISNPGLRLLLIFMNIATRIYPEENNTQSGCAELGGSHENMAKNVDVADKGPRFFQDFD